MEKYKIKVVPKERYKIIVPKVLTNSVKKSILKVPKVMKVRNGIKTRG